MYDPFAKAERWRQRAEELRAIADGMREPLAREALLRTADTLLSHAASLEATSLKISRLHRRRAPAWKPAA